VIGSGWD